MSFLVNIDITVYGESASCLELALEVEIKDKYLLSQECRERKPFSNK